MGAKPNFSFADRINQSKKKKKKLTWLFTYSGKEICNECLVFSKSYADLELTSCVVNFEDLKEWHGGV